MPMNAVCVVRGDAHGVVRFVQAAPGAPTEIEGVIEGLSAGLHGFHIHEFGDQTDGCKSAGGHFNPEGKTHGAPGDAVRHYGDLGNIAAGADGRAVIKMTDKLVALYGEHTVVGRAVVVHAGQDDLGKGGNEESLKTGNAGARVGCGVIGFGK